MMLRRLFSPTVLALILCLGEAPWARSGSSHSQQPPPPGPEERIPVDTLGYRPPGQLYMLSKKVFSSLNFIDEHRLLFTFHQSRLLQRERDPQPLEDDQVIRAVVLRVQDGQVLESSEWRMHDRGRYLWSLGHGKFLIRERNSYLLTDSTLKMHPYIDVPSPVYATEVSPDGRTLVVEHEFEKHTSEEHARLEAQAAKYGDPPPPEDTQITLMDVSSRHVLGALRTHLPVTVPITSTGYIGVAEGKGQDEFVVSFIPFDGQPLVLGKVASTCTPHESFLNPKALLIESCGPKSPDIFLDAWTIDGKKLWTGRREGHLVWPTFAPSEAGGRFAVGLLRATHFVDLADSLNDEDVREQVVQVFDSATGSLLLATNASPILTSGENFALSEDGAHLAVLREGAIEIYKVPSPASPAPDKIGPLAQKK
jgi:hypothetical protein